MKKKTTFLGVLMSLFGIFTMNTSNAQTYCDPVIDGGSATTITGIYIDDFSTTNGITNINNLGTGQGTIYTATDTIITGYQDFSSMEVSQTIGNSINFDLNIYSAIASYAVSGVTIWVDWDQDGVFSNDEIVYTTTTGSATHTGTITVPANAASGATRMRIGILTTASIFSIPLGGTGEGPTDPCGVNGLGANDWEDYTFVVSSSSLACSGTPDQSTITSTETFVCPNESFTLTGTDISGTRIEYQWQSSDAGQNNWSDIAGATSTTLNINSINADTDYQLEVICTNSQQSSFSNIITVEVFQNETVDLGVDTTICEGDTIMLDAGPGDSFSWNTGATSQTIYVDTAGTYEVEVVDAACPASPNTGSITISTQAHPSADDIVVTPTEEDCTFTFSVDEALDVDEYIWDFGDGSPTQSGATVSYAFNETNNYTVQVTLMNDCGELVLETEVDCEIIGIDQLALDNQIDIYPNPTNGLLNIELNKDLNINNINIFNVLGQVIHNANNEVNASKVQIDLNYLTNGLYTIQISTDKGIINKKFVIKK